MTTRVEEAPVGEEERTTPEQPALIHGEWYKFDPPHCAIGRPTSERYICEPEECIFSRGLYKGTALGQYVFEGKPDNDTRQLSLSDNIRNHPEWADAMRICYFSIPLEKIEVAKLEPNQL